MATWTTTHARTTSIMRCSRSMTCSADDAGDEQLGLLVGLGQPPVAAGPLWMQDRSVGQKVQRLAIVDRLPGPRARPHRCRPCILTRSANTARAPTQGSRQHAGQHPRQPAAPLSPFRPCESSRPSEEANDQMEWLAACLPPAVADAHRQESSTWMLSGSRTTSSRSLGEL